MQSEAHVLLEPEARAEREKAAQGARAESSLQSASRGQAVLARFQEANAGAEEEAAQGARAESKLPSQASLAPIQETNARAEQAEAAVPEEEEKRRVAEDKLADSEAK